MSEIDPLGQPPLYEESQVITEFDLEGIRNGFILQLGLTPWYMPRERNKFTHYVYCVDLLLGWMRNNKRPYFKGVYNSESGNIDPI